MDKDFNGYGYMPPYMDSNVDMNDFYKDYMFNPIMQYEQAFSYYRYLCMQMDYKISVKNMKNFAILLLKKKTGVLNNFNSLSL